MASLGVAKPNPTFLKYLTEFNFLDLLFKTVLSFLTVLDLVGISTPYKLYLLKVLIPSYFKNAFSTY